MQERPPAEWCPIPLGRSRFGQPTYPDENQDLGAEFRLAACVFLFFVSSLKARAQDFQHAQPTTFLQSNDRFAFDLLEVSHVSGKEANVVLAPLPVSLSFAALWSNGSTAQSSELMAAFHWEKWPWQCKRKQNAAGKV
jgi:hypothetical protein